MLLTKKNEGSVQHGAARSQFVHSLRRGLSQALPTMDRRAFRGVLVWVSGLAWLHPS